MRAMYTRIYSWKNPGHASEPYSNLTLSRGKRMYLLNLRGGSLPLMKIFLPLSPYLNTYKIESALNEKDPNQSNNI